MAQADYYGGTDNSGTDVGALGGGPDYLSDPDFLAWMRSVGGGVVDPSTMTPDQLAVWWNNYTQYGPGSQQSPNKQTDTGTADTGASSPGSFSGGDVGSLGPFTESFAAPAMLNLGGPEGLSYIPNVPTFTPPSYANPAPFSYADYVPGDAFKAPTMEQAQADPGYKFRYNQGFNALQNWAAAKGTLNDSATAEALQDYGQNAATQEYANVWNRDFNTWSANEGQRFNAYTTNRANALDAYNTNYRTRYVDPYQFNYRGYLDSVVNPQMQQWQTRAAAGQHQNDMNYLNSWNQWLQDWNIWKDKRDTGIGLAGM